MHLLRLKKVCDKTGLSRSSLYVAIKQGEFPKPVSIGKRSVAWKSTDVDAWIESRPIVD